MRAPRPARGVGLLLLLGAVWSPAVDGQARPGAGQPRPAGEDRATAAPAASIHGVVTGRFLDDRRAIPHASVEATTRSGTHAVVTDQDGRFALEGLAPGAVELKASATGYSPVRLRVHLPAGNDMSVDLELTALPVRLSGVSVAADSARRREVDEARERSVDPPRDPALEVALLEISPGVGETGLGESVGALPGNDPADPSDVLFMRGSTTELKLVLLDGVPIYTPFHVSGLLRSFEPTVLESAQLHVGGAPARYDGGLSHILDLRTRTASRDAFHATAAVDLLSASVAAEAPLGSRAGIVASGRTLHDLGEVPLGGERPYGYRDALVSLDVDPFAGHSLRATGFWNEESVRLAFAAGPSDAEWSNRAGTVTWAAPVGGASLLVTAGASRYRARLPLQPTPRDEDDEPEAVIASASNARARVVGELSWGNEVPMRAGVSFEDQRAVHAARSVSGDAGVTGAGSATQFGVYVEAARRLATDLSVRAGLRSDFFGGYAPRLAPRVALFWSLGPDALLSVAAGRYHQAGRTPDPGPDDALTEWAEGSGGPGPLLPVATADHVVVSLEQRIGSGVDLELAGFWKGFEGLRGDEQERVRNSGIDLRVLSAGEAGSIWLGYGLSWFWSPQDLSGSTEAFTGRHLLSAGAAGALFGPLRGEARLAYGAGLPSTSIPFGRAVADQNESPVGTPSPGLETLGGATSTPIASPLDESFIRLDLEIHAILRTEWGGRPWRVRPYLRVMNALDRRDALFYTWQPWRSDDVTPLAERPILPVLGIAFSF